MVRDGSDGELLRALRREAGILDEKMDVNSRVAPRVSAPTSVPVVPAVAHPGEYVL